MEATSLSALESMSCGTPVSTNVGGMPSIIKHNSTDVDGAKNPIILKKLKNYKKKSSITKIGKNSKK